MIGKVLHRDLQLKPDAKPEEIAFNQNLRIVRTVDRLTMVAAFAGFAWLVSIAWKRRQLEGKVLTP
jgi:hypothetical protein